MEALLRPLYQERTSQSNTLGVLLIERLPKSIPTTDTFDAILLLVVKESEQPVFIKHYSYDSKKAALHIVTEAQINEWIRLGTNRKIFEWFYNGRILFDRNEFLHLLKKELMEFPFHGRKVKMGLEFAKLVRRYTDGKAFYENGHYLDAYNHVVHSLHHLARLAVIEHGFHPEITVWEQVRQIEPEIYKLYEEIVLSEESIEKRLELLFLASEYLIRARSRVGGIHLLETLSEKDIWTFQEILSHDELKEYSVDLSMLIEYFIDKGMINVVNEPTKGQGIYHRYYQVAEKLS